MTAVRNRSEVVSFDADAVLDAARMAIEGPIYAFVEYNPEEFNMLYVDEFTVSLYRDRKQMRDHFETIHSYVHVDFTERDLFQDDLFSGLGRVRTFVTQMEQMTLVRYMRGDEGLFFSLPPEASVMDVVDAIDEAL